MSEQQEGSRIALGVSLGLSLGSAVGIAIWMTTGNVAFFPVFMGAGIAIGSGIGAALEQRERP